MRFALLLIPLLLFASCEHGHELSLTVAQKDAVLTDISRLMVKSQDKTLSQEDVDNLKTLFQGNELHGIEEIEALLQIQEFEHITHSLSFLGDYVKTGKELLCPSHHIGHYFLFANKGLSEKMEHSLQEAADSMQEWEDAVRAYDAQYPSGKDLDVLIMRIQGDLEKAQAGQIVPSEEIAYLINDASICVYDEH